MKYHQIRMLPLLLSDDLVLPVLDDLVLTCFRQSCLLVLDDLVLTCFRQSSFTCFRRSYFTCFQPVDISSIISERLSAVRKLQDNPHDLGAKMVLDQAQKKVCFRVSRVMTNSAFCICKNKGADQLHGNQAADKHLCFCYIDSTNPFLP